MKKKLLGIFLAFVLVVLALRFIEIKAPQANLPKLPLACVGPNSTAVQDPNNPLPQCVTLQLINETYVQEIKPIFTSKCLMCHGQVEKVPLYSIVPPMSFLIHHDMKEAREHLAMYQDYPFRGKKIDYIGDMEELIEVVEKNEMPPWIYRLMHWKSALSPREKDAILIWAKANIQALETDGILRKPKRSHDHNHEGQEHGDHSHDD